MSRRALAQSGLQLARLARCSGEQAANSGLPACLQQTRYCLHAFINDDAIEQPQKQHLWRPFTAA